MDEREDAVQSAVQDLCALIVKYDQHDRALTIKGEVPVISGKRINYNLVKGVDANDSKKSIGTIYKRLALITHPDKGGNEADLTIVNNAVAILKNEQNSITDVLTSLTLAQQPNSGDSQTESSFVPTPQSDLSVASTKYDQIMNDFIRMYVMFYQLRQRGAQTSGEIDPYFYAKNAIETTYPGVTVLPYNGDNEETFNALIQKGVNRGNGEPLPSFVDKFEVVKSYNVQRGATEEKKRQAVDRFDESNKKRQMLISAQPSTAYSISAKRPYKSSVASFYRKGGSKNKQHQKQKQKQHPNKTKQKRTRSRKARRTRRK